MQLPTSSRLSRARLVRLVLCLLVLTGLAACAQPAAKTTVMVMVRVLAGPTCPVVTDPPDPACADRPVESAELVVVDQNGRRVTSVRTDAAGTTMISVPAGTYTVRPQPVPGLMGTPAEIPLTLDASTPELTISYDTGIR